MGIKNILEKSFLTDSKIIYKSIIMDKIGSGDELFKSKKYVSALETYGAAYVLYKSKGNYIGEISSLLISKMGVSNYFYGIVDNFEEALMITAASLDSSNLHYLNQREANKNILYGSTSYLIMARIFESVCNEDEKYSFFKEYDGVIAETSPRGQCFRDQFFQSDEEYLLDGCEGNLGMIDIELLDESSRAEWFVNYGIYFYEYANIKEKEKNIKKSITYFNKAEKYIKEHELDYLSFDLNNYAAKARCKQFELSENKNNLINAKKILTSKLKLISDHNIEAIAHLKYDLSCVLFKISFIEDNEKNIQNSLKLLHDTMKIYLDMRNLSKKDSLEYANALFNLGLVYYKISEIKDHIKEESRKYLNVALNNFKNSKIIYENENLFFKYSKTLELIEYINELIFLSYPNTLLIPVNSLIL